MKKFNPIAAIITDLHIGAKNYNKQIFNTQMQFFEKQFFPYLIKHNIKTVFHLGDFFHNRNHGDWFILQEVKNHFFSWFDENDVKFHTLVGNHDSYYKNTIEFNSISKNFNEFKNTIIYDKESIIQFGPYNIWMVPWITDEKEFKFKTSVDIVMGHFDISGMKMLKNVYSSEGFSINDFSQYNLVLSGHYHIRSKTNNINYIGSPYQLSWSDFDEEKGFCLLGDNFDLKYINNEVTPKYIKLYMTKKDEEILYNVQGIVKDKVINVKENETVKIAKNNYIRILVERSIDQSSVDNMFESLNIVSRDGHKVEIINTNEIIEDFDFSKIENEIDIDTNILSLISSYIKEIEFDQSIDKSKLEQLTIDMYKEIHAQ